MSRVDTVTAATEAPARKPPFRVKAPADPGFAALRRAARAALVIPLTFGFSVLVLRESQAVIFVVFGCFALLVMSDFGGLRPPRALAYLAATLVGAILVAVGTIFSSITVVAAAGMLVLGFVIAFSRVFGGYVAAAQTGMLLSYVLAVSIPAAPSAVPARVGGWALAGIVSTLAGTLLWPRFEQVTLRKRAAEAARAVADLVEKMRSTSNVVDGAGVRNARDAEQAARRDYAATSKRPAGPTRRDRAFVELLIELQRIVDIIERPFQQSNSANRPALPEGDRLAARVVAALRASGEALTGGSPPDIRALEDARDRHRTALDQWAQRELQAGRPSDQVLAGLDVDHTLRVVGYLTIAVATNAVIAAGGDPEIDPSLPVSAPRLGGITGVTVRIKRTISSHLEPTSTVMQNSLRVAIGLAIAVIIARMLGLSHAFWVVLGTLQVLRSSALGTGRTTLQALAGNVIGVAIGGIFAAVAGNHPAIMWVALPIAVFTAAYAATAVGFVASQAAFTINLIVIFNLISPSGWQVGLVRIEDIAVGAAISVVVGLLLWPRGVRRELGRSIASFYVTVGHYLEMAFDRVLGFERAGGLAPVRSRAIQARNRAGEAFDAFLNEKSASPLDPETAGFLLSAGTQAMLAADLLDVIGSRSGYQAGSCPDGAQQLNGQVRVLLAQMRHYSDELVLKNQEEDPGRVSVDILRGAALQCLEGWRSNERAGRGAMAVVMASEWIQNLARLEEDLAEPVSRAAAAARTPWWR
ncbi:MAG TPA: FUSC family protein [Candidatus Dormibacteraeota bacterium]